MGLRWGSAPVPARGMIPLDPAFVSFDENWVVVCVYEKALYLALGMQAFQSCYNAFSVSLLRQGNRRASTAHAHKRSKRVMVRA